MDKKGFLFTVTIFLILTYILLSISVWVKGVETSERAYSEFYKESTVELAIEQITPAKIDNITNTAMNRALYRLDKQSIDHPVNDGTSIGNEDAYISDSLYSLLVSGAVPPADFQDGTNLTDDGSSLSDWVSNLNASLLAIGVYVSDFQVANFTAFQGDIKTVNYSFDMVLNLNDYSNTSSVTRTYHINDSIDITGLVDPALARTSVNKPGVPPIYRQFFFNTADYSTPRSIGISKLTDQALEGQGWLYGPLASAAPSYDPLLPNVSSVDPSQWGNYILVGTFSQITSFADYASFAGYIVTDAPGSAGNCTIQNSGDKIKNEMGTFNPLRFSGASCDKVSIDVKAGAPTSKPFIVVPGFDATSAPTCPLFSGKAARGKCALISNKYLASDVSGAPLDKLDKSNSSIYGVESMRDFVMCGYYTQNPAAPSYFQRLLPDSYSRNSSLGIETFVIGEYANSTSYASSSRLDRELFNSSIIGIKIMGLPGCKNYQSCADNPSTGIFEVSSGVIDAYGLGGISCNGARCG